MARFLRLHRPMTKLLKSSFTFGCSMTIGDLICQTFFPQPTPDLANHPAPQRALDAGPKAATTKTDYDLDRTLQMFLTGFLSSGPLSYIWNHFIDRSLGQARTLPRLLAKVAVHSAIFTPIMISSSLISITLLSGRTLHESRLRVENDLPHALRMAYMYWPLQSLIMFRFFANPQSRIVYQSMASGVWNIFLSYLANNHPAREALTSLNHQVQPKTVQQTTDARKKTKFNKNFQLHGAELGQELRSLVQMEQEKFDQRKIKSLRFLRETVIAATILPILHSISFWAKMVGFSFGDGLRRLSGGNLEEFFIESEPFI